MEWVNTVRIRHLKPEIRILGVDDARFDREQDKWTRLVGIVYRGAEWIEGCLQIPIGIDGNDVTTQLTKMVKDSGHFGQLRVIMTRDTIFGGTNVLDLASLNRALRLPVIAISDSKPDETRVEEAMKIYSPSDWSSKSEILNRNGPIKVVESRPGKGPVYIQWSGIDLDQAIELIRLTSTRSRLPEPIRIAHLFASSFIANP